MLTNAKPTFALTRPITDVVQRTVASATLHAPAIRVFRGRAAILARQQRLAELAAQTGQTGEADRIAYALTTPGALKKTPHLITVHDANGALDGAVLIFEYRIAGLPTRVFSTADASGRRSVLARREQRAQVAALAARALMEAGAHVVHVAYSETHGDQPSTSLPKRGQAALEIMLEMRRGRFHGEGEWSLAEREMPVYLALFPSFDQTLAHIGQRTRSNLRYYRRRAELDLGCRFHPSIQIGAEQFLAFNRLCKYAVSDETASLRHRLLDDPANGRLYGVQDGHGSWLSLVFARRNGSFIEIDWQMNRADLPSYSLCTVMRSYLIEHVIAQGATRLYIEGGTPQPIARSFRTERVGELTLKRHSHYAGALERLSTVVFPPKNYLAQTLNNPDLHWRSW